MTQLNTVMPDFSGIIAVPPGKPHEMLSIRREDTKTIVRVNSSSLGIIQTCPRKAFYTLNESRRLKRGAPPLIFGSAIHKALEVFYRYPATERALPENFEDHAQLIGQGYAAPHEHFLYSAVAAFVKEAEPLNMLPSDDKRSIASGVWILTNYFTTYLNDNYVIYSDEHGPVIERPFSFTLAEDDKLRVEYFGTIDFVLRNIVTSEILPGDHKTTSIMGSEFMARVKPNHQYTGYMMAAQKVLGFSGENFLVNGIEVKARPKTTRGSPPKFIRQITRRTEEDFTEFRHVVLAAVRQYCGWLEANIWPLGHVDACAAWGSCEYHDVCAAPNELRTNILNSKFSGN